MYLHCAHTGVYSLYIQIGGPRAGSNNQARQETGRKYQSSVSGEQKSLIDRAAQALGRNRSDFMLETACREAETVLLDRRYFTLPVEQFKRFTAMLDRPPANNARLARLLKTKAPWEK